MTQNEKDLLLKDLCARLPYGVKVTCETEKNIFEIEAITSYDCVCPKDKNYLYNIDDDKIKPCLFPLSSMTKEQVDEVSDEIDHLLLESLRNRETGFTIIDCKQHAYPIDWFNKNHFDYRGLIEKGLAIDATGKNIY